MEILLSADRIQKRVGELASQIAADYRDRPVTIVGVLTGSLIFLADLIRHLDLPLRVGLIQASSYRGSATEPGRLRVQPELLPDVTGRHVLLIDDILDTGQTLSHLVAHLRELKVASLRVGVLLRKLGRQCVRWSRTTAVSRFPMCSLSATAWITTMNTDTYPTWLCCRRRQPQMQAQPAAFADC